MLATHYCCESEVERKSPFQWTEQIFFLHRYKLEPDLIRQPHPRKHCAVKYVMIINLPNSEERSFEISDEEIVTYN